MSRQAPARVGRQAISGTPVYPWFDVVPPGLLTKTQLAELGLKPAGPIQGRVEWRGGRRSADLYLRDEAKPKRPTSVAQLAVLEQARRRQETQRREREQARQDAAEQRARRREQAHAEMLAADRQAAIEDAQKLLALGDAGVVLDLETTDYEGYVVEVGVISLRGDVLLERRCNPQVPISPGAEQVHGITDADVSGCPTFGSIFPELESVLAGRTIIAYNEYFDRSTLAREVSRLFPGTRTWNAETIAAWLDGNCWSCAMHLYAAYVGCWSSYHGSYRWWPLPNATHGAIGDCRAALRVLEEMVTL